MIELPGGISAGGEKQRRGWLGDRRRWAELREVFAAVSGNNLSWCLKLFSAWIVGRRSEQISRPPGERWDDGKFDDT